MISATAERYGQRPSDLLAIPDNPDHAWLRLCVDEALHSHAVWSAARNERRRKKTADAEPELGADGQPSNLFDTIMRDPRVGKPPPPEVMTMLLTRQKQREDQDNT